MGAAKRFELTSAARPTDDDPVVGLQWFGEEETEPWCVDDGSRIVVMRTREIRQRLEGGILHEGVKVWRDGRACWLPVADVYELRPCDDEQVGDEEDGQSRIRRVRRLRDDDRAARPLGGGGRSGAPTWWRRTMRWLFGR
ncbi:MAG TPA: hypothetical protein ENK57_01260 [Polyangiaceae bacterium]|nr:hypothetical protein [Polyangiaceae bacterium]